jgi:L-ascorbate metabolism protein UlaG (beta-lactamase superfamily)
MFSSVTPPSGGRADINRLQAKPVEAKRRRLPRSLKELTPSHHFSPRKFFQEMIWNGWLTRRVGHHKRPAFPKVAEGQVAVTWIGHASFLIQFSDLNLLVDPNFANWLFLLKRLKRAGVRLGDLPRIDLVLLTHAHFDHFHKPTLRKLPPSKIGIVPWGVGKLTRRLRFSRVIELEWWESFNKGGLKITFVPARHWGARFLKDIHRGYGGFVIEHQGRSVYHAGDSAYFEGFKEIGSRHRPEIALLPIGAYFPETFRHVHMGPDEALRAFHDLKARLMIPMHFGTFKLSFESMDEPPRWLRELAREHGLSHQIKFLEEGLPVVL